MEEIGPLIAGRNEQALADRVIALDAAERAEVAAHLPGGIDEIYEAAAEAAHREMAVRYGENENKWPEWARERARQITREHADRVLRELAGTLRIAGAGTIPEPAEAADWLARDDLTPPVDAAAHRIPPPDAGDRSATAGVAGRPRRPARPADPHPT
jgi:hypothetical protein